MKRNRLLLIILCAVVTCTSYAQNFDYSFSGKVNLSDIVFEGRVISKTAFWNNDKTRIYTSNKILVLKQFKGTFSTDTIEVLTQGGDVGDIFQEVSHTLKLATGWEGVFFCKQTDYENIKVNQSNSYRTVYDGQGFTQIFSDPVNPPAVNGQSVYHDITKEVYQPIMDITHVPMTVLMPDSREAKKQKARPLQSPLDSLLNDTTGSTIKYVLENLQMDSGIASFSILSFLPHMQRHFAGGSIIYKYDTAVMGAYAVASGRMSAAMASTLNPAAYTLNKSDLSANQALMQIAPTTTLTDSNSLAMSQAPVSLMNVQVAPLQTSVLTDSSIALDSAAMQQQSSYLSSASTLTSFDTVQVASNVKLLRSGNEIDYSLTTFSVGDTTISFKIAGSDNTGNPYGGGSIYINYSASLFGGAGIASSVTATAGALDGTNYYVTLSDVAVGILQVTINDTNLAYDESLPLVVATLSIPFQYPACINAAGISLNAFYNTGSQSYFYDPNNGLTSYDTATVSGSDNDTLCHLLLPTVSNISSDCIGAGSFDVLIINGTGFGTDTGTVYFRKADNGGLSFIPTQPQDILSWTPTQIKLYIPSAAPNTAGSGDFYIVTPSGLTNANDTLTHINLINIGYANLNERSGTVNQTFNDAEFVYLSSDQLTFQLAPDIFDSTVYHTYGAVQAIQGAINNINCQAGINFGLDTNAASVDTIPSGTDGINLIVIMPASAFINPNDAMQTLNTGGRVINCTSGLPQYNNLACYIKDIDIQINGQLFGPPYWNWNDSVWVSSHAIEDFGSAFIHELGHGAGLVHTLPFDTNNVMYYTVQGRTLRTYNADSSDLLGFQHMFNLGSTLAVASGGNCDPVDVQTYGTGCTRTTPACVPYYPALGINDIGSGSTFSAYLYPNPYQENTVIHIDVSQYADFTIKVYDLLGHLILQENKTSNTSFDVPLANITSSSGLYFVEISDSRNKAVLKMIKL